MGRIHTKIKLIGVFLSLSSDSQHFFPFQLVVSIRVFYYHRTLYCAKGNYEFGVSRIMKSLEPYSKKVSSVSFRKMDKGGQNNTLRKFGGAKGLCTQCSL